MPTHLDIVNMLVAEPTSRESRNIEACIDKVPRTEGAGCFPFALQTALFLRGVRKATL
jgi:hypothetical protein